MARICVSFADCWSGVGTVSSRDFCCDCSMIYDRKLVENEDGHFILVYREDFDVPPEPESENPVRKIFGL